MKYIYVVDQIILFNPKTEKDWEVYSYSEIVHMSHCYKGVDILYFLTGDIYSVFGLFEKMSLLYAKVSPKCIILFDGEKKNMFSFFDLIRLMHLKDTEARRGAKLIEATQKQVYRLSKAEKKNNKCGYNDPVYIKTTMSFGVQAGGAVAHSVGVLSGFEKFFDNVKIYSTDYFPQDVIEAGDFKHISLSGKWTSYELNHMDLNETAYKNIIKWQGGNKPFFVYQRYSIYDYLGLKVARHYNVPLVIEYNSSEIWTSKHWGGGIKPEYFEIAKSIEEVNLRLADIIVCVSDELKDTLVERGVNPQKVLVNYNGVDESKYSSKANKAAIRKKLGFDNKIVIGFCGSFSPFHGADKLAEAFSILLARKQEYKSRIRLLMIGNGGALSQVKRILRKQIMDGEALCVGAVPFESMPDYLAACDILVAPHVRNSDGSEFFGSPTKLFEYMAMEKAIAASNLNQIGSILTNNYNALLFEPGNIDDMVQVLEQLIENDSLRNRLGKAARETVINKYTWKHHVNKIIERIRGL